jgi:hypothetical protein
MRSSQVIIVVVALVIGFAGGFVLRPVLAPSPAPIASGSAAPPAGAAQPSEDEATAAVRRFRAGFQTYTQATLTLGECSAGGDQPGVTCMTHVVLRPGSMPQNRMIGFARVNGQWEVSVLQ